MQIWLSEWINRYVLANPAMADDKAKAKRPLAAAEVQVDSVEGRPGYYNARFYPAAALPAGGHQREPAARVGTAVGEGSLTWFRPLTTGAGEATRRPRAGEIADRHLDTRKGKTMAFTGYLKIDDIDGESKRADHEGEIDVYGVQLESAAQSSSASTGSGRTRGRAQVRHFTCTKWYRCRVALSRLWPVCRASPSMRSSSHARKDSGDAHLDYLTVTLTNCIVVLVRDDGKAVRECDIRMT